MTYVDSNIPMYLVGTSHPNKSRTLSTLETLITSREKLVTCAETIQEILHRFSAIERRKDIQICVDGLFSFVDEIFPVDEKDALAAKDILLAHSKLSARDALHAAVMHRRGIDSIFTFDLGFRVLPNLKLLPASVKP